MAGGREAISLAALEVMLAKLLLRPLDTAKTETLHGVEWRVIEVAIPLVERPAFLPNTSTAPVSLAATVYFRPQGLVDATTVGHFIERNRRALIQRSVVLAAAEGFTSAALRTFRLGKTLDYLSETHWPTAWPRRAS
jgi:hypothetical protein